ncbi:PIN domain-containing protein [Corynebacterium diphtheriae]|uniref:PIN domain-containing protein n=1 Tax=Corynebacterium diphtheriae TaxID=1717 RepID=UPI00217D13A3|nr:PIN domain-containing protein [Corynebacterium diphtheriae]MCS6572887.1 PIN domain-containing protein [Corynebacterium diphtheriae]
MFAAVLDTCVLWPSLQRDIILTLAAHRFFKPLWSIEILEELEFHEKRKLIDHGIPSQAAELRAQRLVKKMKMHFPNSVVLGTGSLAIQEELPDPDDAHVLAAAILGNAGAIVTDNIKHFPNALMPSYITTKSSRDFLADAIGVDPQQAFMAICKMSDRYMNPRYDVEDIIELLEERYKAIEAAELLRAVL